MSVENKILVRKLTTVKEDRAYTLHRLIYEFLKTYPESKNREGIEMMRSEVDESIKEIRETYWKRFADFKQFLYGFWKVIKLKEDGTEEPFMYIYPYKLIESNRMMFTLCSYIKPEFNDKNGLHEEMFDIMEHYLFTGYDLLFEEVTEEEVMENAKKSCEDALNDRMWKLKYRDGVLD